MITVPLDVFLKPRYEILNPTRYWPFEHLNRQRNKQTWWKHALLVWRYCFWFRSNHFFFNFLPEATIMIDKLTECTDRPIANTHTLTCFRSTLRLVSTPFRFAQVVTFHLSPRASIYVPITQWHKTIPKRLRAHMRKVTQRWWSWQGASPNVSRSILLAGTERTITVNYPRCCED